jgi:hypothetical protein
VYALEVACEVSLVSAKSCVIASWAQVKLAGSLKMFGKIGDFSSDLKNIDRASERSVRVFAVQLKKTLRHCKSA